MYLSELVEEILKTDETGQNYPNLTEAQGKSLQTSCMTKVLLLNLYKGEVQL